MKTSVNQVSPYPITDPVISLPQAAVISGVSVDTLKRAHRRGEIRILKLSVRRVGVRVSELNRYIDSRAA
jgi:predicted site-specific integrase-resolvase